MALLKYKCQKCGIHEYKFQDEGRPLSFGCSTESVMAYYHKFDIIFTPPEVVIATSLYMQDYQLDSWKTTYELDRQLNIEVREEKETEFYQTHRINA